MGKSEYRTCESCAKEKCSKKKSPEGLTPHNRYCWKAKPSEPYTPTDVKAEIENVDKTLGLFPGAGDTREAFARIKERLSSLESDLEKIRDRDWVENALDPQWSAKVAKSALGIIHEKCPICEGSGELEDMPEKKCFNCGGSGVLHLSV